jgi:hypothetical protein
MDEDIRTRTEIRPATAEVRDEIARGVTPAPSTLDAETLAALRRIIREELDGALRDWPGRAEATR